MMSSRCGLAYTSPLIYESAAATDLQAIEIDIHGTEGVFYVCRLRSTIDLIWEDTVGRRSPANIQRP